MMTIPAETLWQKRWNELAMVLDEIAGLVDANMPMAAGLQALAEDAPNKRLRWIFQDLHDDLANGFTLPEAMQQRRDFFPPYVIHSVQAGENSGNLGEVLYELRTNMMGMLTIRGRTQDIGLYLFGVLLYVALVLLGMTTFVLPQVQQIFTNFTAELPVLSRLLFEAQTLYLPHILIGFALLVPLLWILTQVSETRGGWLARRADAVLLRLPLIGRSVRDRHFGRAAGIAETLLFAGVPLHEALHIAGDSSSLGRCRSAFQALATATEQGTSLREALHRERRRIPVDFSALLALGEQSGEVPNAMRQIRQVYEHRSLRNSRLALEIGGPLMLCGIGLVVFFAFGGCFAWITRLPTLIDPAP